MESIVTAGPREVVTAARPVPENWHPMSNLDLLVPPVDVGVFFCYRNRKAAATSASPFASILKASLSEALRTYYPFAGEIMSNAHGEPGLLSNNRGVDFIEARCEVCLQSVRFHDPQDELMRALMPEKKEGVLCVQATEFKCGGVVVACSFEHRVADAYSANMFFVAWSEAARSVPFSVNPSFSHFSISPNSGYPHDDSIGNIYVPLNQCPPPEITGSAASVDRIYYITASSISRIQALANSDTATVERTKLEAFAAYLWQVLGRVRANGSHCSLGLVVDGRQRIPLQTYFGNVLSLPSTTLAAEDLREMELSEVAVAVHQCIAQAKTREHFRGLINWVETHKPNLLLSRIFASSKSGEGNMAIVVSSGRQFPLYNVDFGWGKPIIASYCFPWGRLSAGCVMPLPSATQNGDWLVYMKMEAQLVAVLETAAGDVFRPVTAEYLGLLGDH